MVEIIENAVQLVVLTCCAGFACWLSLKKQNRECARLAMFYGSYVLGDLYWLLYLVCYGHTPGIFYVPYMSWYAAYVFLDLLLLCLATAEERKFISWPSLVLPVFAAVMCVYYMQFGDYAGNLVSAVLMSLLMYHSSRGMHYLRKHPEGDGRKWMYILTLVFCFVEYSAWTASCFFVGDTLANPYYWFDFMVTPVVALFLPAFRKGAGT